MSEIVGSWKVRYPWGGVKYYSEYPEKHEEKDDAEIISISWRAENL